MGLITWIIAATAINTGAAYLVAVCVFSIVAPDAMIGAAIVGIVTFIGSSIIASL